MNKRELLATEVLVARLCPTKAWAWHARNAIAIKNENLFIISEACVTMYKVVWTNGKASGTTFHVTFLIFSNVAMSQL